MKHKCKLALLTIPLVSVSFLSVGGTKSNNMWKAILIIETIGKANPTQDELNFVYSVINGGKTDNTERASNICAYMETEGKESIVYEKLCALANER